MKKNYIFLGSGTLGFVSLKALNLDNLLLLYVFTDTESDEIIKFCQTNNIRYFLKNIQTVYNLDSSLNLECHLMISVNYKYIIPKKILQKSIHPINFHGSLLPKYRGRAPHIWAIINGEKETGVTCHYMTENIDDGPIINQIRLPILDKDTGGKIYKKYIEIYPKFVTESVEKILENRLEIKKQDDNKASFFGRRTPIMGYIDFHKNAKDIINFVRALRPPYPSAYCYLPNGLKINIHELAINNLLKIDSQIGQLIKLESNYYVKCNDSLLEIRDFQIEEKI